MYFITYTIIIKLTITYQFIFTAGRIIITCIEERAFKKLATLLMAVKMLTAIWQYDLFIQDYKMSLFKQLNIEYKNNQKRFRSKHQALHSGLHSKKHREVASIQNVQL